MSEPTRVALVGATGLIGRKVIECTIDRDEDVRLAGVARREMPLPQGVRMEMFVAEPDKWGEVFEAIQPQSLICALGTTWRAAGRSEEAFRAVDQDLVLATAEAALKHGVNRMVCISAAGSDATSRNFYLRVKGETERELRKIGFERLDILRPGLLRGQRSNERRVGERLAIIASPLTDMLMQGGFERYRSIDATKVAEAALALSLRKARGKFNHDNAGIGRAARDWEKAGALL